MEAEAEERASAGRAVGAGRAEGARQPCQAAARSGRAGREEPSAAALCGDAPVDVLSPPGARLRGASAAATAAARGARRTTRCRGRKPGRLSEAGRGGLSSRALRTSVRGRLPRLPRSCPRPQPSAPAAPPAHLVAPALAAAPAAVSGARPGRAPGRQGLGGHRCLGEREREGVCARV